MSDKKKKHYEPKTMWQRDFTAMDEVSFIDPDFDTLDTEDYKDLMEHVVDRYIEDVLED